jgi:MFS transporter, BCD family, chlorophyll transporter
MTATLGTSLRLGLVHAALAVTLVPINSTLNRVMIKELGLPATLVVVLASLPYLLAPLQVAIGGASDRRALGGRSRSPYILLGLLLCVAGLVAAPMAAMLLAQRFWAGLAAAAAAFGAWGLGYNLAAVSYLALAAQAPGGDRRSGTVSVMWIMMILAIIATSITLGRLLPVYTPRGLVLACAVVGAAALLLGLAGLAGLAGLERGVPARPAALPAREAWMPQLKRVAANPQARLFFVYLFILLTAILGQDLLLEPFGAEVLGMPVAETSRLASVWGALFLAAMAAARPLERLVGRRRLAAMGGWAALAGLLGIMASAGWPRLFYPGLLALGAGAGLATIANLAFMLDMTTEGDEGLYIGVWAIANSLARFAGSTAGGVLRDALRGAGAAPGYIAGFGLLALLLALSLALLPRVDVAAFRSRAR